MRPTVVPAGLREIPPGDVGSEADRWLGDDQSVGNLTGVSPGTVGEAILEIVDLDGLVGRRPGQTNLDVFALDLFIKLVPRDRDDIDGSLAGCRPRGVTAHRVGSQVGVIVPLEHQVHMMSVEDGHPCRPQLGVVSTGMRGIDRVVEHDKLPGGARLSQQGIEPLGLAPRRGWIRDCQGAVEHGEKRAPVSK